MDATSKALSYQCWKQCPFFFDMPIASFDSSTFLSWPSIVVAVHLGSWVVGRLRVLVKGQHCTSEWKVVTFYITPEKGSFRSKYGMLCYTNIQPKVSRNTISVATGEQNTVDTVWRNDWWLPFGHLFMGGIRNRVAIWCPTSWKIPSKSCWWRSDLDR